MVPFDIGLGVEGEDWTLALFTDCAPGALTRLVRRSVECSGGADTLDFFVSLADPAVVDAGEIRHMVDSLNSAFSHPGPVEWSFVIPEKQWLERLRFYHDLKAGRPPSILEADMPDDLSAAMAGTGLSCHRIEPGGVLKFLSSHLHGFTPPSYPHSIEGFTAHDSGDALLVTADSRIFAAWRDVMASPAAGLLPEGWEVNLARYGYLLARVLPHFSAGQPFAGAVAAHHAFPENA